jgi:hypothetical protein
MSLQVDCQSVLETSPLQLVWVRSSYTQELPIVVGELASQRRGGGVEPDVLEDALEQPATVTTQSTTDRPTEFIGHL